MHTLLKLAYYINVLLWLCAEEPPVNELLRSDRDWEDADDIFSFVMFVAAGILDPIISEIKKYSVSNTYFQNCPRDQQYVCFIE